MPFSSLDQVGWCMDLCILFCSFFVGAIPLVALFFSTNG